MSGAVRGSYQKIIAERVLLFPLDRLHKYVMKCSDKKITKGFKMKKVLVVLLVLGLLFGWFQAKPVVASTASFQVSSSTDAVNEDGATFTAGASSIWLGNGSSATASYTAVRFTNLNIPNGAVITSAKLSVYSTQNQWIGISFSMAGDLSANSPAFSSTNRPSQRGLTTNNVSHSSNVSWSANTWYTLDEMAPVVQEIIDQSGWQSGNSLSIILKGTGRSWGRKFASGWSASNNHAPKLEITYTGSTPSATATTQANSPTPTLVSTFTSIPSTATSTNTALLPTATATIVPPTATIVPPTATIMPPTATATRTATTQPPTPTLPATSTPGASTSTIFSIGPGGTDVIPHQIIRTADDRVYLFGVLGDYSSILYGYWTTASGLPNKASDFAGPIEINNSANILSAAAVYDGSHIIHVLTNDQAGMILDYPFDTATNQFKTTKTLDTTGAKVSGNYIGSSGLTGMMDQNSVMHIVFWSANNHVIYRSYTYNVAQDTLNQVDGPTQIDINGSANHPNLAISPVDGSITVAWVSQASNPARILARTKSSGTWGAEETVNNSPVWTSAYFGINIDQGPSLTIGLDGTKYLAYIENWRVSSPYDYGRVHYVTNSGSGWTDQYIGSYSHDPAVAINSLGQIYIIGHGYPLNSACITVDDLCLYKRNSNGTWATPLVFLAHQGSQSFDASPSVKWSVVGFNRPDTIEFLISDVGSGYGSPILYYGRIGSNQ